MEVLKSTDWSKINEAYQVFINTGEILPDSVRDEVANSWRRSKNINPWQPRPQPIDEEEFEALLEENQQLAEIARPIMEYMHATNSIKFQDNLINLAEKSGVVLDFQTRLCTFPSPWKKRVCESSIGTCITAVVLAEQKPLELGGPEQYSVCYQTLYGGGAPINDSNNDVIGAILLYNNYGKIPEQPIEFVEAAALLISDLLQDGEEARKRPVENHELFTRMINYIDYYILVVDSKGKIVNVNDRVEDLFGLSRDRLVGRYCYDFGIKLERLISDNNYMNKDYFSVKADQQSHKCLLENNKTVKWLNNQEHTLLMFSSIDTASLDFDVGSDGEIDTFQKIIGRSPSHGQWMSIAKRASTVEANVLIDGESGTGKEVFARAIHNASKRASKPFVAINCGSLPKEILQSELFGYAEGAFTGGKKGGQIGKFEAADGGTILLDEIGEMPLEMQVSMLRFLQDKTVVRLGESQGKKVNVRVIAATNRDLQNMVDEGQFRQDLFYRLKVIYITLPPLRERKDDISLITDYYIQHYARFYDKGNINITNKTRDLLYLYNWPGNIRELANVIENAVIFVDGNTITPDLLPVEILEYEPGLSKLSGEQLKQHEKEIITKALIAAKGNVSDAARSIGISRNTLYRKIDKYHLEFLK